MLCPRWLLDNQAMLPTISRASDPGWQDRLVDALMDVPDAIGVSATTLAQSWRNARARVQLRAELEPLTSREACARFEVTARQLEAWRTEARVLSLSRPDGGHLYPPFQFGSDGKPKAEISEIIDALNRRTGWDVCLWLVSRCETLDDRRPIDVLESNPAAVIDAARHEHAVLHAY